MGRVVGRVTKNWVVVVTVAVAAVLVTAGCDPADGLAAGSVSATTDQLATHALKKDRIDVQWLSCSATTGTKSAKVDCLGRTEDQQKISVKGDVTEQLDDKCVKGRLTAVVGKRTVFDVTGLGNCAARPPSGS